MADSDRTAAYVMSSLSSAGRISSQDLASIERLDGRPSVDAALNSAGLSGDRILAELAHNLHETGHATLGRYRLVRLLGFGGMGEVWLARHETLGRLAAVKIMQLPPGASKDLQRQASMRFAREAKAMSGLSSPHTVEVYDFGETDGGNFYYAMELLEGLDGRALVEGHGPVALPRCLHLADGVCKSLAEAHERGLVHRDLKPANIFLCRRKGTQSDFVKVLDFGLVTPIDTSGTRMTQADAIMGTPAFMAPECHRGAQSAPTTDVYGLGCTLFWFIRGRLVFEAETRMQSALAHMEQEPEPLASGNRRLDDLVAACLQKDPDQRPADAHEVSVALADIDAPSWSPADGSRWWAEHAPDEDSGSSGQDLTDTMASFQGTPSSARSWRVRWPLGPRAGRIALLAAALVGAIAATVMTYDHFSGPTVSYVGTFDVPHDGVYNGELATKPSLLGPHRFAVTHRKGKVLSVQQQNAAGNGMVNMLFPMLLNGQHGLFSSFMDVPDASGFANHFPDRLNFIYDDEGALAWIDSVELGAHITHRVEVARVDGVIELRHGDALGAPRKAPDLNVYRVRIEPRDGAEWRHYFDNAGAPMASRDGTWGQLLRRDAKGRIIERTATDAVGTPMVDRMGVIVMRFAYDDAVPSGVYTRLQMVDLSGSAVNNSEGWSTVERRFDARGRPVEERIYDRLGEAVVGTSGCHGWAVSYDDSGLGHTVSCKGLDWEVRMGRSKWGSLRREFDPAGHLATEVSLDEHGEPVQGRRFSGARWTRDVDGRLLELTYLGSDGEPTVGRRGWATQRYAWDQQGSHVVEVAHFDASGDRTVVGRDGYSVRRLDYKDDQVERVRYFDADQQRALNARGVHASVFEHNGRGDLIRRSFTDAEGQPTADALGHWGSVYERDERGNAIEVRAVDKQGNTRTGGDYCRVFVKDFDAVGRETRSECRDAARELVSKGGRPAIRETEYDDRGNVKEKRFLGPDEELVEGPDGYAFKRSTFDERNRLIEEATFGVQRARVADDDGCARYAHGYDGRGNRVSTACFDVFDRPANRSGSGHREVWRFDKMGYQTSKAHRGANGEPWPDEHGIVRTTWRHDARGNRAETSYFDADGNLQAGKYGWARKTATYDSRDRMIEAAFFDDQDDPVPSTRTKGAHAVIRRTLREDGYVLALEFEAADGGPLMDIGGVRLEKRVLGDVGLRKREQTWHGDDGRPVVNTEHSAARMTFRRDTSGRIIRTAWFDADNRPALGKEWGVAIVVDSYEEGNDPVTRRFQDGHGAPMLGDHGYAGMNLSYNAKGDEELMVWVGLDGEPVDEPGRASTCRTTYDRRDDLVRVECQDARGQVAGDARGVAVHTITRDEHGNKLHERWEDARGRAVDNRQGYAEMRAQRGPLGGILSQEWLTARGEPVEGELVCARLERQPDGDLHCIRSRAHRTTERPAATTSLPVAVPQGTVVLLDPRGGTTLELKGAAGTFQPGSVPAGKYTALATFSDGIDVPISNLVVPAGGTLTVKCKGPPFDVCKVLP